MNTARSRPASILLAAVIIAGVTIVGCDKRHKVTNPVTAPLTLEQAWPHSDGRTWTFRDINRTWDVPQPAMYASPELVPAVTFDTVAAVLAARPAGANPAADTATVTLHFNGTHVIGVSAGLPAGLTVQMLEQTQSPLPLAASAPWKRSLLASVAIARPDLRARLASLGVPSGFGTTAVFIAPTFLRAGPWRLTSQGIGTYDPTDGDTLPDWKFLPGDLTPGSGFRIPLLPNLASDVTLNGRVIRRLNVPTPAGTMADGIEAHYFIDYGLASVTDQSGNVLGYTRTFSCGSVLFASGVGPVYGDERSYLTAGQSRGPAADDLLMQLVTTTP